MARGGKRAGAGRKPGSQNRPKFQLTGESPQASAKPNAETRMQALRRQVALLVADDMPRAAIAAVMGMPIDKLERLFRRELEHGHALVRADVLLRLNAAGYSGSVSADRALETITGQGKKRDAEILTRFRATDGAGKMQPINLYDRTERDAMRRRVIEFWVGASVPIDVIGQRLGLLPAEVAHQFPSELQRGRAKWDADAIVNLFHKARSGETDAAALWLFATQFEYPPVAQLLCVEGRLVV